MNIHLGLVSQTIHFLRNLTDLFEGNSLASHNATFYLKVNLHKHILDRISVDFMGKKKQKKKKTAKNRKY